MMAVGFYNLVERLTAAEVPIVFLMFPRFIEDPEYLFSKLSAYLPGVSAAQASAVHARIADVAKVRVGNELSHRQSSDLAELNVIALHRLIATLRDELSLARAAAAKAHRSIADRFRGLVPESLRKRLARIIRSAST
jgi:hypothetical protein